MLRVNTWVGPHPSYRFYISELIRSARCCTSVLDFRSKRLQITSNFCPMVTNIFVKHSGNFFQSDLLYNFLPYHFKNINKRETPIWPFTMLSFTNLEGREAQIISFHREQKDVDSMAQESPRWHYILNLVLLQPYADFSLIIALWRTFFKHPQRHHGPELYSLWVLVGIQSKSSSNIIPKWTELAKITYEMSSVSNRKTCPVISDKIALHDDIQQSSKLGAII